MFDFLKLASESFEIFVDQNKKKCKRYDGFKLLTDWVLDVLACLLDLGIVGSGFV